MTILYLLFGKSMRATAAELRRFTFLIANLLATLGAESASGFALFERVKSEEIGMKLDEVQKSGNNSRF